MKRTSFYLTIALIIISIVSGCGRKPAEPDSRLAAADALMQERPDSAKLILDTIDAKAFADDEANNAFFALLRVQSDYRNYIVATPASDSLIDIALDYYTREHNANPEDKTLHEHYTRSLIYKGTVNEELGNPTDAMRWYKEAETKADPNDHNTLGYINLRIAYIYYDFYAETGANIKRFLKALGHYQASGNKHYQMECLNFIGTLYRLNQRDSAEFYLNWSSILAKELGDSVMYYDCQSKLVRNYMLDSLYSKAKTLALRCVNDGSCYIDDNVFYDLICAYARLGEPDSAQLFLNKTDSIIDSGRPDLKMMREKSKSLICLAQGDYKQFYAHDKICKQLIDSLDNNKIKGELNITEMEFDKENAERIKSINVKNGRLLLITITILLIVVISLTFMLIRKCRIRRQLVKSFKDYSPRDYEHEQLQNILSDNIKLLNMLTSIFDTTAKLVRLCYSHPNHIFIDEFKRVTSIGNDRGFWKELEFFVNQNWNNIIKETREKYPFLSEEEIYILELSCCNLSYVEIAVCLGKENINSLAVKKSRIVKKMGITTRLKDYIKQYERPTQTR